MRYVVNTFSSMFVRYLRRRVDRLAYYAKRPLHWAEIASACLVFAEVFNIYNHAETFAHAGMFVHPVAASATMLALVAHLPEL